MRISDWSSDVCSSDLAGAQVPAQGIVITALELVAAEHGDQRVVVHVSAHVHVFEIGRKRGGALGRRGSREGRLRSRRGCRRVIAMMRMRIVFLRRGSILLHVMRMGIVLCGGRQGGASGNSRQQGEGKRPHSTRTSRNMPSSMCSSMWQD